MVGALERVMVCSPRTAGWNQPEPAARWQELGFHHAPDFAKAQAQHEALCRELKAAGAELVEMPAASDLSLDAVYAHDASLATDHGLIVMRPGKPNRVAEGPAHAAFCETLEIETLCWSAAAIAPTQKASSRCAMFCRPRASKFFPRHCPTVPAHPRACI